MLSLQFWKGFGIGVEAMSVAFFVVFMVVRRSKQSTK